jgi:AcrR family transcriptional regulator
MSTQPGIAFVAGANSDLARNTALDLADPPYERGDAARNRALLVDAARRLIAARGPDTVTMDEIAAAAGVGKGTLFRRFGSRAGLMIALLSDIDRDPQSRYNAPITLHRNHIHALLKAAGTTGHLDARTEALLVLLQADFVDHQINERGLTLEQLGDAWESLARKLCGR